MGNALTGIQKIMNDETLRLEPGEKGIKRAKKILLGKYGFAKSDTLQRSTQKIERNWLI